jgi:hypothetical protein
MVASLIVAVIVIAAVVYATLVPKTPDAVYKAGVENAKASANTTYAEGVAKAAAVANLKFIDAVTNNTKVVNSTKLVELAKVSARGSAAEVEQRANVATLATATYNASVAANESADKIAAMASAENEAKAAYTASLVKAEQDAIFAASAKATLDADIANAKVAAQAAYEDGVQKANSDAKTTYAAGVADAASAATDVVISKVITDADAKLIADYEAQILVARSNAEAAIQKENDKYKQTVDARTLELDTQTAANLTILNKTISDRKAEDEQARVLQEAAHVQAQKQLDAARLAYKETIRKINLERKDLVKASDALLKKLIKELRGPEAAETAGLRRSRNMPTSVMNDLKADAKTKIDELNKKKEGLNKVWDGLQIIQIDAQIGIINLNLNLALAPRLKKIEDANKAIAVITANYDVLEADALATRNALANTAYANFDATAAIELKKYADIQDVATSERNRQQSRATRANANVAANTKTYDDSVVAYNAKIVLQRTELIAAFALARTTLDTFIENSIRVPTANAVAEIQSRINQIRQRYVASTFSTRRYN